MRFDKATDWPTYVQQNVASDPDPIIQSLISQMNQGSEEAAHELMKIVVAKEFNGE